MISNNIKEEMYAKTKTVGTRRVHTHSMKDNTYMHTKQIKYKTLGNTVPDKLFHFSSEI